MKTIILVIGMALISLTTHSQSKLEIITQRCKESLEMKLSEACNKKSDREWRYKVTDVKVVVTSFSEIEGKFNIVSKCSYVESLTRHAPGGITTNYDNTGTYYFKLDSALGDYIVVEVAP
jgi:hypothetical protein